MSRHEGAAAPAARSVCPICEGRDLAPRHLVRGYTLLRCAGCGGFCLDQAHDHAPAQGPNYQDDYWDLSKESTRLTGYIDYDADLPLHARNFRKNIEIVGQHSPPGTLLDIGCGTGHFMLTAARAGFSPKGVDVSHRAIARVGALGFEGWVGHVSEIELTEKFDVITLWETIEHLPAPGAALARLRSWLKPSGVLCISTGDNTSLLSRALGKRWWYLVPPDHCVYYNPAALATLLGRNGFRVVAQERILLHWVSARNILLKLLRSFQVKPRVALALARRCPGTPLPVLHGTTIVAIARPDRERPADS